MKPFKFFERETIGNLIMMDDLTRATASFNADTPDGHVYRRRLYHTNPAEYHRLLFNREQEMMQRLGNPNNNNEMERYFYDRNLRHDGLTAERISDMARRINGGGNTHTDTHGNTDYVPFFTGESRVTRVNPKWWMKIKMFFQTISLYWDQIWGVVVFALTATISVGLVISKILNLW